MSDKQRRSDGHRKPLLACIACGGCAALLLLSSGPRHVPLERASGGPDAGGASGTWKSEPSESAVARVNSSLIDTLPYAPFGYHVDDEATGRRHIQRWGYIRSALVQLVATWHELDVGGAAAADRAVARPYRAMDWGANQGYFSSGLLYSLPNARVLSVDPNDLYFKQHPLSFYKDRLQQPPFDDGHRERALLCKSKLTVDAIEHLSPHGALCPAADALASRVQAAMDVQLTLSVFHWLDLPDRQAFFRTLARHVRAARATILELPEPGHTLSANSEVFMRWYNHHDQMVAMVQQAMDEHLCDVEGTAPCLLRADVRLLGENVIDYGVNNPATTTREVLLISLRCTSPALEPLPQVAPPTESACMNWLEAAGCAHSLRFGSCTANPTFP